MNNNNKEKGKHRMDKENCTKCGKQISSDELIENGGLCSECMNERELEQYEFIKNSKEIIRHENRVASVIKILSAIIVIIGIIIGLYNLEDSVGVSLLYILVSIIISIFVYAIGEGLQLLQEIAINTK